MKETLLLSLLLLIRISNSLGFSDFLQLQRERGEYFLFTFPAPVFSFSRILDLSIFTLFFLFLLLKIFLVLSLLVAFASFVVRRVGLFRELRAVWYVCLKIENCCLEIFIEIRVGEKVYENT